MPRAEIPAAVDAARIAMRELRLGFPMDEPPTPQEEAEVAVKAAAPHWLEQLKEEGEVAVCHACGYIDDPRQSSCSNCGAQMQRLPSALTASIRRDCMRQLKEERFGDAAQAVVVDFLASWSYCPVSQASDPARSCLDDAARQLLDALKASIPIEEGGDV